MGENEFERACNVALTMEVSTVTQTAQQRGKLCPTPRVRTQRAILTYTMLIVSKGSVGKREEYIRKLNVVYKATLQGRKKLSGRKRQI